MELKTKIAEMLEVDRNTVTNWIERYNVGGMKALRIQKRGPKTSQSLLTIEEQNKIRKAIVDKEPEQYKLELALWTREAVGLYIEKITGQKLDLRQVGRYLKKWGFTARRPFKRAYQRCKKKFKHG